MDESGTLLLEAPIDTVADPVDPEPDLGYRVDLDAFSGPLDLLLYLVRRSEVDIYDIHLSDIADQFIATIRSWEETNLDLAGDFILMVATLLEIKARAIMPVEDAAADDDEEEFLDPRHDLIRQLLAFRECKTWGHLLQGYEEAAALWQGRTHAETIPESADEAVFDLDNADPYQLFRVWDDILADIAGKCPRTVVYDDVPIEDRMRQITAIMQEAGEGRLSWLMGHVDVRIKRIGVLVALLECVRKRTIEAIQHEQYGDVFLLYHEQTGLPVPHDAAPDTSAMADHAVAEVIDIIETGPTPRKRRPPLQLVTFHAPVREALQEELPESDEVFLGETEEDRFLRELNDCTRVDAILSVSRDLDRHLHEHLVRSGVCQGPLQAFDAVAVQAQDVAESPAQPVASGAGQ